MNNIAPVQNTNNIRYADFVRVTTPTATYRFATTASALTIPAVDPEPFDALGALVKVGETKKFRVIAIDPDQHKLSLSLKSPEAKQKTEKPAKAEKTEEKAEDKKEA